MEAEQGIQRLQHDRIFHNVPEPQTAQHHEPQEHYRPENLADELGAPVLEGEDADQNRDGDRQDVVVHLGPDFLDALRGREDGDGGGNDGFAAKHCGADKDGDDAEVEHRLAGSVQLAEGE